MSRYLTILRGLPGSGKTTYAKQNWPSASRWFNKESAIVSADHFFTDQFTEEYRFDGSRLGEAHARTNVRLLSTMNGGCSHVIADNTHCHRWEWSVAEAAAWAFGYEVRVIDLFDGGLSDEALEARNVHHVPAHVIARMRREWER